MPTLRGVSYKWDWWTQMRKSPFMNARIHEKIQ